MLTVSKSEIESYLPELKRVSRESGSLILDYYNGDPAAFNVQIKDDKTPVTAADRASHQHIVTAVGSIMPHIPIVSEEASESQILVSRADINVQQGTLLALDPLDGTKEFLGRTGAFTVQMILFQNFEPVLVVVYNPVFDVMYYATKDGGAWRQDGLNEPAAIHSRAAPTDKRRCLTALFNVTHGCLNTYAEARQWLAVRGLKIPVKPDGAPNLPRMMRVAEGGADINVVCGRGGLASGKMGHIWDYGTVLILEEAGGVAVQFNTRQKLAFKDAFARVDAFVALGDRALARRAFPGLRL